MKNFKRVFKKKSEIEPKRTRQTELNRWCYLGNTRILCIPYLAVSTLNFLDHSIIRPSTRTSDKDWKWKSTGSCSDWRGSRDPLNGQAQKATEENDLNQPYVDPKLSHTLYTTIPHTHPPGPTVGPRSHWIRSLVGQWVQRFQVTTRPQDQQGGEGYFGKTDGHVNKFNIKIK